MTLEEYTSLAQELGIDRRGLAEGARLPDVMASVVPDLGSAVDPTASGRAKPPPIAEDLSRFAKTRMNSGRRLAKHEAFYGALDRAGMSATGLASALGVERRWVSNWLHGNASQARRWQVWALLNEEQRRAVPRVARPKGMVK